MKNEQQSGFVKIHRQITQWEWYNDINTTRLFIHLLLTANFEDKKWRGKTIKRGQLITSLSNLAAATTLSVRSVRTSLNKLKMTNEITSETTNKFTLIELVKYASYQDNAKIIDNQNDKEVDNQETNKRQTNDKQTTTTKELKEIKNIKNNNSNELLQKKSDFEEFWDLYDYKKSKPKAEAAYLKALKITNHEKIIAGVNSYRSFRGADKQFWKHPTTWLNAQSWDDEYQNQNYQNPRPQAFKSRVERVRDVFAEFVKDQEERDAS